MALKRNIKMEKGDITFNYTSGKGRYINMQLGKTGKTTQPGRASTSVQNNS
jgi:hypothetical protein